MLSFLPAEKRLILWMPSKKQKVSPESFASCSKLFYSGKVCNSSQSSLIIQASLKLISKVPFKASPLSHTHTVVTLVTDWPKQCRLCRYFGLITKHPAYQRFACHVFFSEDSTTALAESVGWVCLSESVRLHLSCLSLFHVPGIALFLISDTFGKTKQTCTH